MGQQAGRTSCAGQWLSLILLLGGDGRAVGGVADARLAPVHCRLDQLHADAILVL